MPEELKYKGGLIVEPLKEEDWVMGGSEEPEPIVLSSGDWRPYKPNPEKQATKYFDPYSCVSESATNAMEEKLALMMEQDSSVKSILEKLEMLDDDGKPNLSGRFLAVMSGTVPGVGNSQSKVFDTLRNVGIVGEKVWPSNPDMTEDQYFASIPQNVKDRAKEFFKYFNKPVYKAVSVSVVPTIDQLLEALKKGPLVLCVGGAYLGEFSGAQLYRNSGTVNYTHQTNNISQRRNVSDFNQVIPVIHDIFDTYDPFDKPFYEKYPFGFAKILLLTKKKVPMLYKLKTSPAIYIKHWSKDLLIPFSSGVLEGGDLFKSLYGITNYSELPRQDVDVLPYPVAEYGVTTAGLKPLGLEN